MKWKLYRPGEATGVPLIGESAWGHLTFQSYGVIISMNAKEGYQKGIVLTETKLRKMIEEIDKSKEIANRELEAYKEKPDD